MRDISKLINNNNTSNISSILRILFMFYFFKKGGRHSFPLLCPYSWAQGLCAEIISKVNERADRSVNFHLD